MAHGGGNQNVDGGDRLKGQGVHVQLCFMQGGLHRIDNLPRQEGGNDDGFCFFAALAAQTFEWSAVEQVADGAVADAVVERRIVYCVRIGQRSLRGLNAGKVKVSLLLRRDDAAEVHFRFGSHRVESASCRSDGGVMDRAGLFF